MDGHQQEILAQSNPNLDPFNLIGIPNRDIVTNFYSSTHGSAFSTNNFICDMNIMVKKIS
jgi:hypothetical protein